MHQRFAAGLIVYLLLAGCAFGDRTVFLDYPPKPSSGSAQAATPAAAPPAKSESRVVVGTFRDDRPNKKNIGFVQNTYGMETADVLAANDVSEWIRNALILELKNVGFAASRGDAADASGQALLVTGNIEKILTKAYFSYDAEVIFSADILRSGKKVGGSRYIGEGSAGVNIAATAVRFGQSLALALRVAIFQLVADIAIVRQGAK